jgi:LPXTG-motif cell wall-anchored protein
MSHSVEIHYSNERFNLMKKLLTGIAVAAMAVAGIGGSASAGTPTDSIWDILSDNISDELSDALEDLGIRDALDDCSDRLTVFLPGFTAFPGDTEAVLDGVANELGYLDAVAAVEGAPTKVAGLLNYHVVGTLFSPSVLANEYVTSLQTALGLTLTISDGDDVDEFEVNDIYVDDSIDACNGVIYPLGFNVLVPPSPADPASCGVSAPGACPVKPAPAGSGEGLPATGSESMALTYAALASLIAGAGVLVLRRRSVA